MFFTYTHWCYQKLGVIVIDKFSEGKVLAQSSLKDHLKIIIIIRH